MNTAWQEVNGASQAKHPLPSRDHLATTEVARELIGCHSKGDRLATYECKQTQPVVIGVQSSHDNLEGEIIIQEQRG